MKKTILIVNGRQTSPSFASFSNYIAKQTRSRQLEFTIREPGNCANCDSLAPVIGQERSKNTHGFRYVEDLAEGNPADVAICDKWADVIEKLRQESRYADLMIIDPATSFKKHNEELPTSFAKEALRISECPVLIAPHIFDGIADIVFCYDGSASSVFAIRQFIYLFPEYNDKNAIILHVAEPGKPISEETNSRIHNWLKPHFASVNFHLLEGNVKDGLAAYFSGKEKLFVVMGAYGRSLLSSFFTKSAANSIIRLIDLPLFITHH